MRHIVRKDSGWQLHKKDDGLRPLIIKMNVDKFLKETFPHFRLNYIHVGILKLSFMPIRIKVSRKPATSLIRVILKKSIIKDLQIIPEMGRRATWYRKPSIDSNNDLIVAVTDCTVHPSMQPSQPHSNATSAPSHERKTQYRHPQSSPPFHLSISHTIVELFPFKHPYWHMRDIL